MTIGIRIAVLKTLEFESLRILKVASEHLAKFAPNLILDQNIELQLLRYMLLLVLVMRFFSGVFPPWRATWVPVIVVSQEGGQHTDFIGSLMYQKLS